MYIKYDLYLTFFIFLYLIHIKDQMFICGTETHIAHFSCQKSLHYSKQIWGRQRKQFCWKVS